MLRVKLREAMEKYQRHHGDRMTYERLAQLTGLSRATLESVASRGTYNTRLSTVAKLCTALNCQPGDLLEMVSESDPNVSQD